MTKHTLKIEEIEVSYSPSRSINFLVHYVNDLMRDAISIEKIHGFFLDKCFDGSRDDDCFVLPPFTAVDMWHVIRTGQTLTKEVP
jgi:hypothetical protein